MFILRKVCLFPLTDDKYPKSFFISLMMFDITYRFLHDNLLSSTYQVMVNCVPSIVLFATHLSYRFMSKPTPSSVVENSLYHNNIDSI